MFLEQPRSHFPPSSRPAAATLSRKSMRQSLSHYAPIQYLQCTVRLYRRICLLSSNKLYHIAAFWFQLLTLLGPFHNKQTKQKYCILEIQYIFTHIVCLLIKAIVELMLILNVYKNATDLTISFHILYVTLTFNIFSPSLNGHSVFFILLDGIF